MGRLDEAHLAQALLLLRRSSKQSVSQSAGSIGGARAISRRAGIAARHEVTKGHGASSRTEQCAVPIDAPSCGANNGGFATCSHLTGLLTRICAHVAPAGR